MIKILFVNSATANLPEINAYLNYFNSFKDFKAISSNELHTSTDYTEFDVIWEFKGFGGINNNMNRILVHEYASLSTGKIAQLKNNLKSKLNKKPDMRVFLNRNVHNGFNFTDSTPYLYRDMGIDENFFEQKKTRKEYDFVYVGSISKDRKIDTLLSQFSERNNGTLCLIGEPDIEIYRNYKNKNNIIFTGKLPYSEVPKIASLAEYGINYIPNKYPYNIQTSTKLLEYLALGLKVVTTDYYWVREFEKQYNNTYYYLNKNNFDIDSITNFDYKSSIPKKKFQWNNIIENSGLRQQILSTYNGN